MLLHAKNTFQLPLPSQGHVPQALPACGCGCVVANAIKVCVVAHVANKLLALSLFAQHRNPHVFPITNTHVYQTCLWDDSGTTCMPGSHQKRCIMRAAQLQSWLQHSILQGTADFKFVCPRTVMPPEWEEIARTHPMASWRLNFSHEKTSA